MNSDDATTARTDVGPPNAKGDVESDPGKDDEASDSGTDWSDEGGATPSGPATETDAS